MGSNRIRKLSSRRLAVGLQASTGAQNAAPQLLTKNPAAIFMMQPHLDMLMFSQAHTFSLREKAHTVKKQAEIGFKEYRMWRASGLFREMGLALHITAIYQQGKSIRTTFHRHVSHKSLFHTTVLLNSCYLSQVSSTKNTESKLLKMEMQTFLSSHCRFESFYISIANA